MNFAFDGGLEESLSEKLQVSFDDYCILALT
jgi:hypothetical protein